MENPPNSFLENVGTLAISQTLSRKTFKLDPDENLSSVWQNNAELIYLFKYDQDVSLLDQMAQLVDQPFPESVYCGFESYME